MMSSFQSLNISRFAFSSSTNPRGLRVATCVPSSRITREAGISRNAAHAPTPIITMKTMYTADGTPVTSFYDINHIS